MRALGYAGACGGVGAGELIRHEEVSVDGQPWITMRPRQVRPAATGVAPARLLGTTPTARASSLDSRRVARVE